MRSSEVNKFYDDWSFTFSKVFEYKREFFPTDYVCIRKEVDKLVVEQDTSRMLGNLTKDEFIDLMCKEQLRHKPEFSSWMIMINLKTGGCTCAAWVTGLDAHHDSICDLVKHKGWRS